jgi:hypothetical protein
MRFEHANHIERIVSQQHFFLQEAAPKDLALYQYMTEY